MKKRLINVVTLGCSKNLVDSEHLMAQLRRNNFDIIYDSNSTDAKIVIINTCGFIGDAKEESINTILGFVRAKEAGEIDHLFVMGCLAERYKMDLEKEIPEVIKRAEKVELEKGDLPAILLAGFVNFVLPLMLMCGAICLIAYLLFTIL